MFARWLIYLSFFLIFQISSLPPPEKPSDWGNWTFSQKISWRGRNLDPRIPYGPLVDKLLVKKIVQDEMPTAKSLFATDDPSQIFKKKLPRNFVMKANNGSGRGILVRKGNVIATRKRESDFIATKCTNEFLRLNARQWLSNLYAEGSEKQYGLVKPMILFEEYLEDIGMDIELYFFNGKVRVISVFFNEDYKETPMVSYYDENWNLFDTTHPTLPVKSEPIGRPLYLDKLIAFGERLAEKIDHVRIDFFISNETVYFGEFTFTTGGGGALDHLNAMIGNYWDYPDPSDPLINPYLNDLILRADQTLIKR